MSVNLEPAVALLETLCDIHGRLVDLARQKHLTIMANKTEELGAIVQAETELMRKSRETDKQRAAIITDVSAELGIEESEVKVSRLALLTDDKTSARLLQLNSKLSALLATQKELNLQNRNLLEAHIEYTETMLNAIVGPEDPLNNFYSTSGLSEQEKRQSAGFFDTQI